MKKSLLAILLLFCLTPLAANRAWITDKFEAQLRSGPGNQHRVVKTLAPGAAVAVADGKEVNGFTKVKLESGQEGWVATRSLSLKPLDTARMGENPQKLTELLEDNQRLASELEASKSNLEAARQSNQTLTTENARLNSEVIAIRQASADVLQIQKERDQLTQDKVKLENELDAIKRERSSIEASVRQNWFLIGAGVLFGGILLGLLLPRLSWRKKSSWDSF